MKKIYNIIFYYKYIIIKKKLVKVKHSSFFEFQAILRTRDQSKIFKNIIYCVHFKYNASSNSFSRNTKFSCLHCNSPHQSGGLHSK